MSDPSPFVSRLIRLVAALPLASLLFAPPPLSAQYIVVEKEEYWPNEPIVIHHRFSASSGVRQYEYKPWDARFSIASIQERFPDPERPDLFISGTTTIDPNDERGSGGPYGGANHPHDTLMGFSMQMFETRGGRSPETQPVAWQSVAIFNPVQEEPGAIAPVSLVVRADEQISISVALPEPDLPRFEPAGGQLVLYTPPAPMPNGMLLVPEETVLERFSAAGVYDVTFNAPLGPGRYELQVRNPDGFILDRAWLEVLLNVPRATLTLSANELLWNQQLQVAVERPPFPSALLTLTLTDLVAGPSDAWQLGRTTPLPAFFSSPGIDSMTLSPIDPGSHRLVAHWGLRFGTHDYGDLLAGSLDYAVAPPAETAQAPPRLVLSQGAVQQLGDPIEIGIVGSSLGGAPPYLLELFSESDAEGGSPVEAWTVENSPELIVLPDDVAPGRYELVLTDIERSDGAAPREIDRRSLTLLPPRDAIALEVNGGAAVVAQSRFTISAGLPAPFNADDSGFELHLVHLGGETQGCLTLLEQRIVDVPLDGQGTVTFGSDPQSPALAAPGRYEARLFYNEHSVGTFGLSPVAGPAWSNLLLLASVPFEVSYRRTPGAIALVDTWPTDEMDVAFRIRLPGDYARLAQDGSLRLEIERQAERSFYGVERLSWPRDARPLLGPLSAEAITGQQTVSIPLPPGHYDLRLVQKGFCFLGSCRRVLLDRLLFDVMDEAYEGPLTTGLAADELAGRRLGPVFPAIGLPGSCGDPNWLPPPEDIVALRLVYRIDEDYVPVVQPLNYGDGFHVQAELEKPARFEVYGVTIDLGSAGGKRSVALTPDPENPRLLHSGRLYLLWPDEER